MPLRRIAVAKARAPRSCWLPEGTPTTTAGPLDLLPAASYAAESRRWTAWLAACSPATSISPRAQPSPSASRLGKSHESTTCSNDPSAKPPSRLSSMPAVSICAAEVRNCCM